MCFKKLIKLIPEIYEGWKNLIFENPEMEELAKKRIAICTKNKCKKLNKSKFCNICACYIPAKVRSQESKCPIGEW